MRFHRFFCTFKAFFVFWPRENWGREERGEKFFKRAAEKLTETLATEANKLPLVLISKLIGGDLFSFHFNRMMAVKELLFFLVMILPVMAPPPPPGKNLKSLLLFCILNFGFSVSRLSD